MIDQNVLLQIDATIIAGVLILLTIGHFRNEPQFRNRTPLSYRFTAVIILPFATSAMLILWSNLFQNSTNVMDQGSIPLHIFEIISAFIGFLYLIAVIIVLAFKKSSENSFDFEIKEHYWYPPEKQYNNSIIYTIMIEILLKNTSDRDTVVNTANISFTYKGKEYSIDAVHNEIEMKSGDSKTQHFNFSINENEIQLVDNITNVKLKIVHTHDFKEKTIPVIKRLPPRIL